MRLQTIAEKPPFSADTIIADAIAHGPDIAAVFVRYRMYCIGCTFARFENLKTAAINHQVDIDEFVEGLNEAARKIAESQQGSQVGDSTINQTREEA